MFEFSAHPAIHVWIIRLDAPDHWVRYGRDLLSADECRRAESYSSKALADEFTICRAFLRGLLARYARLQPRELEFSYSVHGKPSVTHLCPGLTFNVSNAGGFAAHAITMNCEIGIDIEPIRTIPDLETIAARFFSPDEHQDVLRQPHGSRHGAFFRCWTRKEAFIKATGSGLSFALDRFRVTVLPEHPPHLLHIDKDSGKASQWKLVDLKMPAGLIGSLAYRGETRTLMYPCHPGCVAPFEWLAGNSRRAGG